MKIAIAIDSFKGSISSKQAIDIAQEVFVEDEIIGFVISDGGEGFIESLEDSFKLKRKYLEVKGFNHQPFKTYYAFNNDIALLEVAQPLGITLVKSTELNPHTASSYGLGQQINDALDNGCTKLIIGLGGSATNDGGKGMMQALGVVFYDKDNNILDDSIFNHHLIDHIDTSKLNPKFTNASIQLACDVTNPLLHEKGATYIFGPQKGVTSNELAFFEAGMSNYHEVIKNHINHDYASYPGAGAAGGIGYAFYAFSKPTYNSGLDLLVNELNLETKLNNCSLLITGEGSFDKQSLDGKAVSRLALLAKKREMPCFVLCGNSQDNMISLKDNGITLVMPIIDQVTTLEEAIKNGPIYLKRTFIRINTLLNLNKKG